MHWHSFFIFPTVIYFAKELFGSHPGFLMDWTEVTTLLPHATASVREHMFVVFFKGCHVNIFFTSIPLLGIFIPFWRGRAFVSTDLFRLCCWSEHRFMEKCPLIFSYSIPGGWMYELQMFFRLLGSPCGCSFLYNFVHIAVIIAQLVCSYLFSNSQSDINTWTNRYCKQTFLLLWKCDAIECMQSL